MPITECIPTHYAIHSTGYGYFQGRLPDGRKVRTTHHRVVYALHHGLDPLGEEMKGKHVDHLCRNRTCINVDHLELVSMRENFRRGIPCHGSAHPESKLKESDIPEIERLYQSGVTQREIGRKFGVSQPTISDIIRGATWARSKFPV